MATIADALLLEILKACAQAAPEPLYPPAFAAHSGLDRSLLDQALDQLRLRGLLRFTDWVREKGQGYALTSEGAMVVRNPGLLKKALVAAPAPVPVERVHSDTPWARGEAVRDTLVNRIRPTVCMTLLGANILVFAVGLLLAQRQGVDAGDYMMARTGHVNIILDELGALRPLRVTAQNQWWRLLSYAFVHFGILHLLMNMYFLYSLGPVVEQLWGSARFLYLYLASALIAACAVMLTGRPAVGASGALCGMLTSLGVWVYLNRASLPPQIVSSWMGNVVTNIVLMTIISTMSWISWEAHLGGAIGGALVSIPLNLNRYGTTGQKLLGLLGMLIIPLLAVGIMINQQTTIVEHVFKIR